jgi:hypothetical protein
MNKTIELIPNPRKIDYYEDLVSDNLTDKVYENDSFEVFKLKIKKRHVQTVLGEIDFLIRDKSNNLKHILVYCYMMEPDNIFRIEYYINDILLMPSKEVIKVNPLLDSEIAEFYVKELTENYIKKKYELI